MPSGYAKNGINSGRFTREKLLGNKNALGKNWKWTKEYPTKLSLENKKLAIKKAQKKYRENNHKIYIARTVKNNKQNRKGKREQVIKHYGGNPPKCNCCGEKEIKFLTIDHINNDGAKHRKEINANNISGGLSGWIIRNNYPEDFQVLCMNCNWGKYINLGKCPHKNNE